MPRLLHYGPGFQYAIYWRRKGSTYWNKNMVKDSGASKWEVEVNDTYGLYEIKVKAENQMGESRQPAFIFLGHSGEGGKNVGYAVILFMPPYRKIGGILFYHYLSVCPSVRLSFCLSAQT